MTDYTATVRFFSTQQSGGFTPSGAQVTLGADTAQVISSTDTHIWASVSVSPAVSEGLFFTVSYTGLFAGNAGIIFRGATDMILIDSLLLYKSIFLPTPLTCTVEAVIKSGDTVVATATGSITILEGVNPPPPPPGATKTWKCIDGVCTVVGEGTGDYDTLNECIADTCSAPPPPVVETGDIFITGKSTGKTTAQLTATIETGSGMHSHATWIGM